jgi:DNA-3-methyladenine glycosylase II
VFTVPYFRYSRKETDYLKARDPRLGAYIDRIGKIKRQIDPDLFSALINAVIGQQISAKAHKTVWARFLELSGQVTPENVTKIGLNDIQACGLTFKKAGYIKEAAERIFRGDVSLQALKKMPDSEVITSLIKLPGLGVWTAEMLLIFSLKRPDIFSYDDLAVRKGLKIVHGLKTQEGHIESYIARPVFEEYRQLYSPHGSVASLYLWAVAGGAGRG